MPITEIHFVSEGRPHSVLQSVCDPARSEKGGDVRGHRGSSDDGGHRLVAVTCM